MSVIDDVLVANMRHRAEGAGHPPLPTRPSRRLAIVTCMDSRLDVFAAMGLGLGEAHVLRNAGALATEDVVRGLMLSQRLLGTAAVLVVGHTRCGLLNDEAGLRASLEAEAGVPIPFALGAFSDVDAAVAGSVRRLRANPLLAVHDEIRGAVYDVDTHALREVQVPD